MKLATFTSYLAFASIILMPSSSAGVAAAPTGVSTTAAAIGADENAGVNANFADAVPPPRSGGSGGNEGELKLKIKNERKLVRGDDEVLRRVPDGCDHFDRLTFF